MELEIKNIIKTILLVPTIVVYEKIEQEEIKNLNKQKLNKYEKKVLDAFKKKVSHESEKIKEKAIAELSLVCTLNKKDIEENISKKLGVELKDTIIEENSFIALLLQNYFLEEQYKIYSGTKINLDFLTINGVNLEYIDWRGSPFGNYCLYNPLLDKAHITPYIKNITGEIKFIINHFDYRCEVVKCIAMHGLERLLGNTNIHQKFVELTNTKEIINRVAEICKDEGNLSQSKWEKNMASATKIKMWDSESISSFLDEREKNIYLGIDDLINNFKDELEKKEDKHVPDNLLEISRLGFALQIPFFIKPLYRPAFSYAEIDFDMYSKWYNFVKEDNKLSKYKQLLCDSLFIEHIEQTFGKVEKLIRCYYAFHQKNPRNMLKFIENKKHIKLLNNLKAKSKDINAKYG